MITTICASAIMIVGLLVMFLLADHNCRSALDVVDRLRAELDEARAQLDEPQEY